MTATFLAPKRDDGREGRMKASGGTVYYSLPGMRIRGVVSNDGPILNADNYGTFLVASPVVVDQLAFEVVTGATGNARVGLYAADTDWQPVGNPLADSGDIDVSTNALKTYTPSTPIFLPRGRYLTVYNSDATITARGYLMSSFGISTAVGTSPVIGGMRVARTYAAFPSPGTKWTTVIAGSAATAACHWVILRLSAL